MKISLNGSDWQFKDFMGMDWIWANAHLPGTGTTRGWRQGTVPGSVHHDLLALSEIPDPYFERNSLLCEWVPDRTWIYKRTFQLSDEYRDKRIQVCFEGVDYDAQFFLNGERLGEHRSMYTPAYFDIGHLLKYGEDNLLAVVIEPAPHEQPQIGKTSLVRTVKSRMTYWWDFCPRLVHLGIWDSVGLNITGPVRINNTVVRPMLSDDLKQAEISVTTQVSAVAPIEIVVEVNLFSTRNGTPEPVTSQRTPYTLPAGNTTLTGAIQLDNPELWWPNGQGEQPLYTAEVRIVLPKRDEESDRRETTFGIRRIGFVPNENASPSALPYTLVVNGVKTFIKGWNWVPIDVMYGVERPEKLECLLDLAQQANVNMLRVWGGGLIEKEAFYSLCDQLGILVWQEFILSSSGIDNIPSDDPQYIEFLVREAEQIIPRKRNHPSLAIWSGGNELQSGPDRPLDDSHPVLTALREVVTRLDPDRHWLPTSPSGSVFSNSLENIERDPLSLHDVHGPWEHQGLTKQYTLYNRSTSLLHSEFGAEGLTNLKTLKKVVSEKNRWPVTLDNLVWNHLGAWWVKEAQWRESLGEVSSLEVLVNGTQYLQSEGVRYAIESARARKYQNSGTLPWQFNEPFPMAACTSAVDYYGQPKPLYYAVARAYRRVGVTAQFDTQNWQGRDTFEARIRVISDDTRLYEQATVEIKLIGVSGKVYHSQTISATILANAVTNIVELRYPLADVEELFFLDLSLRHASLTAVPARYLFTRADNLASALTIPETTLDVQEVLEIGTITVTNTGTQTAMFVWIEDAREPDAQRPVSIFDNYFCLLPGETYAVEILWLGVPDDQQHLTIKGWNTPTVYL